VKVSIWGTLCFCISCCIELLYWCRWNKSSATGRRCISRDWSYNYV